MTTPTLALPRQRPKPRAKKILTENPAAWDGLRTAEVALLYGLTISAACRALLALEQAGFTHAGAKLMHADSNEGKTERRGNAHFVWFFQ